MTVFKVGDRVIPIGMCEVTGEVHTMPPKMRDLIGTPGTVIDPDTRDGVLVKHDGQDVSWRWAAQDLVLSQTHVKYRLVKHFNGETLYKLRACKEEQDRFVKMFGFYSMVTEDNFSEVLKVAQEYPSWIKFALIKGLIEEEEVYYREGSTFKKGREYYIIAKVSHNPDIVQLTNMGTGNRWTSPAGVEDRFRITEADMERICNGDRESFVPVTVSITKTEEEGICQT